MLLTNLFQRQFELSQKNKNLFYSSFFFKTRIIVFNYQKAPVPIRPWNGIRDAKTFGPKCPTLGDLNEMIATEREKKDLEDCLNMAIYTTNVLIV